jgi:RecB family exonuclease
VIDRVDRNQNGDTWVVTDYKTGSDYPYATLGQDRLGFGTRLQLPVYALALAPEAGPAAGIIARYTFVSAKGGHYSIAVPLGEVADRFRDAVATIVAGIEAGFFPQVPKHPATGEDSCRFCDFLRICPPNRAWLAERKAGDPRYVAHFLAVAPSEATP